MKSTLDQLTDSEREALAHFYELPGYKALVKLHNLELVGLGKDALASPDFENVQYLRGRAHQSKVNVEIIREVYKAVNKES